MANPPQTTTRPRSTNLVRTIIIILIALLVLLGLAILITWLAIKPKKLVYTIEDGSVHDFNLTHDHLTANFDFVIKSHNPNHKISFYFDTLAVSVSYDDQTMASSTVEPFFQPHKNVTRLEVRPVAHSVALMRSVARDLRLEKSSGVIELAVYLKTKYRFKFSVWKSRRKTLKIMCKPVFVHLYTTKHFERAYCDVDF